MLKRIDPTLLLLFYGIVLFTAVLIFVEWRFNSDGQVFQVISSIVAGFAGAFFARMNPKADHKEGETSTEVTVTKVEAQPKKEEGV